MNKERLKKCRYYHGEEEPPEKLQGIIRGRFRWRIEKKWVTNTKEDDDEAVDFLYSCRLSDEWLNDLYRKYADVSPVLIGCFFSELCHGDRYSPYVTPYEDYAEFLPVVLDEYVSQDGLT